MTPGLYGVLLSLLLLALLCKGFSPDSHSEAFVWWISWVITGLIPLFADLNWVTFTCGVYIVFFYGFFHGFFFFFFFAWSVFA
jgi:hypothetical protein